MENLLALYGRQAREHGQIRNSFGDFEPSWIAGLDVGAMGAALLADPGLITDRHRRRRRRTGQSCHHHRDHR
jgi:hypothetical protein